jgi:hypothetical protein
MMEVRTHNVMGRAVVSVWCRDIGAGHDHCLWSGGRNVPAFDPLWMLEATRDALSYVTERLHQDELPECTADCLQ